MKYSKSVFLFSVFFVAGTQVLHAQETADVHPYLTQKFFLDTGIYFPDRNLRVSVAGPVTGPNDPIDLEGQFGLDRSDETFSLNFGWRFGKKWDLGAQYFESSGARGAVLGEDIEWNDIVFGQGTNVIAGQDFRLIRMFFGRKFESSERQSIGVGAGIHWLELGVFIEGDIIVNGGGNPFRRESVVAEMPLPNIGAWYMYSVSPNWAVKARVDWFSAEVGDYDGELINASLGMNYQMFEHFGVGVSYNFVDLDVTISKSDWKGRAQLSYEGVFANLSFYW